MLWTAIYGFLIPIASRGKIAWAMLKQGWRLILKLVRERKALHRCQPWPYPGIVDNQAYHELDSQSRRHVGHSRPGDRALLVKSSIPGRVSRRDDIGAEVAAQLISRNQIGVVTSGRFGAGTLPVPRAALMMSLSWWAAMTVGNQRDSRVSISRKTTSWLQRNRS